MESRVTLYMRKEPDIFGDEAHPVMEDENGNLWCYCEDRVAVRLGSETFMNWVLMDSGDYWWKSHHEMFVQKYEAVGEL